MFNEITIGPVTLHMYGLMIGLGFLAAYAMCYYRGKKMKMEKKEYQGILKQYNEEKIELEEEITIERKNIAQIKTVYNW